MPIPDDVFRKAMGSLAAGVSIITTVKDSDRRGLTATAVCSVSVNPPTLLVCVNTNTGTFKMMEETGIFAVNFIAEAHKDVAEIFAGRNNLQGDERFQYGDWSQGNFNTLPILNGALAALECRVDNMVLAGTHAVFFGIVESATFNTNTPLLYHSGQFYGLPIKAA